MPVERAREQAEQGSQGSMESAGRTEQAGPQVGAKAGGVRLTRHFVTIYSARMGKPIGSIGEHVMSRLSAYDWPGNVRELQNVIERAVILSTNNRLELGDSLAASSGARASATTAATGATAAGATSAATAGPTRSARTLEQIQREHIQAVLESVGWRISGEKGAANILGLKRTTLEARMSRLGISRPQMSAAH